MNNGILYDLYTGSFPSRTYLNLEVYRPSEKATALAKEYKELVADYPPGTLEKQSRIPEKLMKAMKRMGLFGISIPERYGGLGLSLSDYLYLVSVMAEEDMSLAIVPLAHLSIGMKGILLFGTEEQKRRYLTPAASGEMIFAYALTEPKVGSDAKHIETTARLSDDGRAYILNGSKTFITNGGYAGGFTVFARIEGAEEGTIGAFIVETAAEGVTIGKDLPKMGLHVSSTTPVMLKNVRVPKENLLGAEGDGFKIAMSILNYGRLGLGAASTGAGGYRDSSVPWIQSEKTAVDGIHSTSTPSPTMRRPTRRHHQAAMPPHSTSKSPSDSGWMKRLSNFDRNSDTGPLAGDCGDG